MMASDSGWWMASKDSVRPCRSRDVRTSSGTGSAKSPARLSASSINAPISQLVRPILAEAG